MANSTDAAPETKPDEGWPRTISLSVELPIAGEKSRVLTLREPVLGDALAAGVFESREASAMCELAARVGDVSPVVLRRAPVGDYLKISRALTEALNRPASTELDPSSWPIVMQLAKPIAVKGRAKSTIELREATTGDYLDFGLLDGNGSTKSLVGFVARMAGEGEAALSEMALYDFAAIAGLYSSFLSPAAR